MNIGDIGVVFGVCTSLMTGGGFAADYYLKNEYVPVSALLERDARELRGEIRGLEYDRNHGGLSDRDQWLLDQLKNDLEELERKID